MIYVYRKYLISSTISVVLSEVEGSAVEILQASKLLRTGPRRKSSDGIETIISLLKLIKPIFPESLFKQLNASRECRLNHAK